MNTTLIFLFLMEFMIAFLTDSSGDRTGKLASSPDWKKAGNYFNVIGSIFISAMTINSNFIVLPLLSKDYSTITWHIQERFFGWKHNDDKLDTAFGLCLV